ncbi:hypothetical protein FHX52_3140 [Humibacillus xanthopallidus]|uniref:Uncharacterized protein n=1 Tax=Humibacillus xanthopallidus TaxID=412689 RepID=A0A543PQR5_9MICO|nr:hypothetical protein FHX52_3140 [Humibacillus xanthopallidus]
MPTVNTRRRDRPDGGQTRPAPDRPPLLPPALGSEETSRLDGATLRGSQRLSLVRTISAVLWVSSDSGSGAYTLACEFDHAYGTPKTYAALVELETWAGGGGLLVISPATATGTATPRNLTITLMR